MNTMKNMTSTMMNMNNIFRWNDEPITLLNEYFHKMNKGSPPRICEPSHICPRI